MNTKKHLLCGVFALAMFGQSFGEQPAANTTTPKSNSWLPWMSGKKEKTPEADVKDKESIQKSVVSEQNRKVLHREEKAYFRRLEACDRLMQIAIKNNDMDMQNKLLDLQDKIQVAYSRKTSSLQLPVNMSGANGLEDLETSLEKDAARLLSKPETKTLKNATVQRKDN